MEFIIYSILFSIFFLYYWMFIKLEAKSTKKRMDRIMFQLGNLLVVSMYIYINYVLYFFNSLTGQQFLLNVLLFVTIHIIFILYKCARHYEQYNVYNLIVIVFCFSIIYFEMPLYQLDKLNVNVHAYHAPQLLGDTNIYVLTTYHVLTYKENVNMEHPNIYEVVESDNAELYEYNDRGLWNRSFLSITKTFEQSIEVAGELANAHEQAKSSHENDRQMPNVLTQAKTWQNTSGPSAGLAFYVASLIEYKLLENKVPIGITGAIDEKGNVTNVGGIKFKALNAMRQGIPVMIVPEGNLGEAVQVINEYDANIKAYAVKTVQEATEIIHKLNK